MFNKTIQMPVLTHAESLLKSMRPSERWLFYFFSILLVLSTVILMNKVYVRTTTLVPDSGGKIIEGVLGAPRFVNPVLAISQTDKDLSELIYAGLLTKNTNGALVPELAKSYTISDDALTYTFTLRDNLSFHDGTPLTADDVVFTIKKAMQPDIKSPERANWEGVEVKKVDDLTITFTLTKPYAQFLQNALLGILPQEHWGELTADEFIFSNLNTAPIGSGPYKFVSSSQSTSGIPTSFTLSRFTNYVLGAPFIKKFIINFYSGQDAVEDALDANKINSMSSVTIDNIKTLSENPELSIHKATLPRIFAVFFNKSHNEALEYKIIRKTLRGVINTEALVQNVLDGYGQSLNSILLPNDSSTSIGEESTLDIATARKSLEKAGWKINEKDGFYHKNDVVFSLTLATANSEELKEMATSIAATWTKLGAQVKVEVFEPGNLTQSVLRTREYDALLFGEIVGTEPDPYAFWHSSQRHDPGLNIANYSNTAVDGLLLKARKTVNNDTRAKLYEKAAIEINKDIPAIFLYAPSYVYVSSNQTRGIKFAQVIEPHERFANVHLWHINTDRVWHFLAK